MKTNSITQIYDIKSIIDSITLLEIIKIYGFMEDLSLFFIKKKEKNTKTYNGL